MAKQLRQARAIARVTRDYLRYDLPEIVFPSSLPNPPGYVPEPKKSHRHVLRTIWRVCCRYVETWDSKKMREERLQREGLNMQQAARRAAEEGPGLGEEFAAAAKGGSQALKPFLANLYQSRAVAYKNAVQEFVEGYKQGFQQAMRPEVPPEVAGEMEAATVAAAAESSPVGQAAAGAESPQAGAGGPSPLDRHAATDAGPAGETDNAAAAAKATAATAGAGQPGSLEAGGQAALASGGGAPGGSTMAADVGAPAAAAALGRGAAPSSQQDVLPDAVSDKEAVSPEGSVEQQQEQQQQQAGRAGQQHPAGS